MARCATINQDDVNRIADGLIAKGIRPTVRVIVSEHGSGSNGTVQPLIKVWQQASEAQAKEYAPSEELIRSMQHHFRFEVAKATESLRSGLNDSEELARDLAKESRRQASEIDALQKENTRLKNRRVALLGNIEFLREALVSAKLEADAARQEMKTLIGINEHLKATLEITKRHRVSSSSGFAQPRRTARGKSLRPPGFAKTAL